MSDDDKKSLDSDDDKKSFLSRWSNRKSESKENLSLDNDDDKKNDNQDDDENLSDEELANKYEVENPENLKDPLDLKEVLKKNIPDRLKQVALRKLWTVVPIYGEVSELVEYGEDFTDAATVVKNLQSAYVVGKGYIDKVIEKTDEVVQKTDKVMTKSNSQIKKNKSKNKRKKPISQNSEKINQKNDKLDNKEGNQSLKTKSNVRPPEDKSVENHKKSKPDESNEKLLVNDRSNDVKAIKPAKMVFIKELKS